MTRVRNNHNNEKKAPAPIEPDKHVVKSKSKSSNIERLDSSWIPATATYNYMMKDPLLDWLKRHDGSLVHRPYRGIQKNKGTQKKIQKGKGSQKSKAPVNNSLVETKSNYNFTAYIMEQGKIFEKKVMKLITKKFEPSRVIEINGELDSRNPQKVQETFDAMKKGIPIIHSGILHDPVNKTFGIPDLLVRSDWLKYLVDDAPLSAELETESAPNIGEDWHYRVVDIKFTGLLLRADGLHLLNSGSFPAYKAQLLIYNWALGHLQGYTPDQVYILGRRWKYTSHGEIFSGNSCFDRLGIIDYSGIDNEYIQRTTDALEWLREVDSDEAADWNIMDYPLDRWELYPNMCNTHDYPWHTIKEKIANENSELTELWMVGPKNRTIALENGISQWTDPDCTPSALGVHGPKTSKILSAIIDINQSDDVLIAPERIKNNIGGWQDRDTIEFYVDFETSNGVISNIKNLPGANTDTIVFMIGVGYIDPKSHKWIYRDFTVNRLTFLEEERICEEFSNFVRTKAEQYGVKKPRCIHWARAEDTMWSDAVDRHDPISDEWQSWTWDWLDLLVVFKEEPIVINGCMSFGLKEVSAAMKKHGFIKSTWNKESDCIDGRSAMIAARSAHYQARDSGVSMKQIPIMNQIIQYNEVDVKVLYEIVTYLRKNHTRQNNRRHEQTISDILKDRASDPTRKRKRDEVSPEKKNPRAGQEITSKETAPRKKLKAQQINTDSSSESAEEVSESETVSVLSAMNEPETPMNSPRYNFRKRKHE